MDTCIHSQFKRLQGLQKSQVSEQGLLFQSLRFRFRIPRQSRMVALSLSLVCGGLSWGGKAPNEAAWDL